MCPMLGQALLISILAMSAGLLLRDAHHAMVSL